MNDYFYLVRGVSRGVQRKFTGCALLLMAAFFLADVSAAAPYFRGTGLLNIPTAYVAEQGLFDVGVNTIIRDRKRDELAMRMDFGVFNLAELGLMVLRKEDDDYITGNIKVLFYRESGSTPGLSIGVDNFGEQVQDSSGSYRRSVYGVISKQFNLPIVHLISGHLGVGNRRYVSETSVGKYLHGVFMGLNKEFYLSLLNSSLRLICELDGKNVNAGLRYMMDSGLSLNLAIGGLNSNPDDMDYHIGVSFTNAPIISRINQSSELAKKAVRIANEARSSKDE